MPPDRNRPARGAILIVAATALIAATSLIAKVLGTHTAGAPLHPFQVSAGRFAFAFAALAFVSPLLNLRFHNIPWKPHILRSLSGWLGVTCMFAAAARMPLAEATAISFLSPIATMILAIPLLGERVGPIRWSAAGIAVVGALILIRPGGDAFQAAALIALASALFMGFEVIFIKRLSNDEPTIRILFINNAIGASIALTAALFVWRAPTVDQWLLLGALGVIMVTAQTFFILAMKSADASYVIPFMYATLVFAALYDFWLFETIPDTISALGASVIIAGALFLAYRESYLQRHRSRGT